MITVSSRLHFEQWHVAKRQLARWWFKPNLAGIKSSGTVVTLDGWQTVSRPNVTQLARGANTPHLSFSLPLDFAVFFQVQTDRNSSVRSAEEAVLPAVMIQHLWLPLECEMCVYVWMCDLLRNVQRSYDVGEHEEIPSHRLKCCRQSGRSTLFLLLYVLANINPPLTSTHVLSHPWGGRVCECYF